MMCRTTRRRTGRPGSADLAARELPSSKFVLERAADDPRSKRGLRNDELIGADERAGVRIAEVFPIHGEDPVVFRDAQRRVEGRVSRILETAPGRRERSAQCERGIRTRLRE